MRKSLLPRLNPPDGDRENAQPSESEQGTEGLNEEEEQESLGRGRRVRKSNARYSEQLPPRTGRASRRSAPHDKASTTTSLKNTAATSNTAVVADVVAAEAANTESAAPSTAATKAPAAAVTMRSARSRASLVPPATSSAGQLKNTTKKGKRGRPSLIVPLTRPGQQEEEEKSKEEVRSAVDEDSRDSEVLLPGK